jgi:hypothetical protein
MRHARLWIVAPQNEPVDGTIHVRKRCMVNGGRGDRVKRRELIALLGGATAWPLAAQAQQQPMPVVGFVNSASPGGYVPMVAAFRQGLKEAGYVEGQNVAVEYRWAEGQYDRVPVIALELVDRRVAVLVANTPGVLAVKAAITTTPHRLHHRRSDRPRREYEPPGWQYHGRDHIGL